MSENRGYTRCPRCGNAVRQNVGGLYLCTGEDCDWRSYSLKPTPQPISEKEGKPGSDLTSGQNYRMGIQNAFGYESEKNVYRLINKFGNVQVSQATSGLITVTIYPGGGAQRIPMAQGTVKVDITNVQKIHLNGAFPYAIVNIDKNCSGQPMAVLCHVKS